MTFARSMYGSHSLSHQTVPCSGDEVPKLPEVSIDASSTPNKVSVTVMCDNSEVGVWGSDGLHAWLVLLVVERSSGMVCASCEGTYGGCSQGGCSFSEPVDDTVTWRLTLLHTCFWLVFFLFRLERAPATRL
jgi:hypothetical protein